MIIKTVHVISETGRPQITFRTLNKSGGRSQGLRIWIGSTSAWRDRAVPKVMGAAIMGLTFNPNYRRKSGRLIEFREPAL